VDAQQLRLLGVNPKPDVLEVEDDIAHIFHYPGDGREFVHHTFDADRHDCCTLKGREEHAAKGVAQRVAEAALERLTGKLPVALGLRIVGLEFARTNQFTPISCDQLLLHGQYPQSGCFGAISASTTRRSAVPESAS